MASECAIGENPRPASTPFGEKSGLARRIADSAVSATSRGVTSMLETMKFPAILCARTVHVQLDLRPLEECGTGPASGCDCNHSTEVGADATLPVGFPRHLGVASAEVALDTA